MEWLSFAIGLVIGTFVGVLMVRSRSLTETIEAAVAQAKLLKMGEVVNLSITIGKGNLDDDGELDINIETDREPWRNN